MLLTDQSVIKEETKKMARERQRKSPEERKAQIIRAAAECFMKRGFHKTTIDDIARKAGLGKGTIYLYFKDKDDIFIAFYWSLTRQYSKEMSAILKSGLSAPDKIYKIGEYLLGKAEENPDWNRSVHQLLLQAAERPKVFEPFLEMIREFLAQFEPMVREAMDKKELRQDINPRLAAGMIATLLSNLDLIPMIGFKEIDAYDYWQQVSRILFEGIGPRAKARH
jgi:TetR/AcrR family fatty acid metabolism transcriptional regulator